MITLNKSSRRKILIIGVPAIVLLSVFFLYPTVGRFLIGQHQKNVILLLVEWRDDFEEISSEAQAFEAIDMYEYASTYYNIAGEGYFSSEKMSSKLAHQRRQTLETIITSLEDFTGLQYGHDLKRWKEWREHLAPECSVEEVN